MKITPHTIFVYSWGNFLRIVRGEHHPPEVTTKPRTYKNLVEALEHEHRPRVVEALRRFPPDQLIDRRLKVNAQPVKVKQHRTVAEAIKSPLFIYAQIGRDPQHREIAYIYHRNPANHLGIAMARSGPPLVVRKLLKKYKRPALRELDYRERKPKIKKQEKAA